MSKALIISFFIVPGALALATALLGPPARAGEPALPVGIPPLPAAYADWPRIESPIPLVSRRKCSIWSTEIRPSR